MDNCLQQYAAARNTSTPAQPVRRQQVVAGLALHGDVHQLLLGPAHLHGHRLPEAVAPELARPACRGQSALRWLGGPLTSTQPLLRGYDCIAKRVCESTAREPKVRNGSVTGTPALTHAETLFGVLSIGRQRTSLRPRHVSHDALHSSGLASSGNTVRTRYARFLFVVVLRIAAAVIVLVAARRRASVLDIDVGAAAPRPLGTCPAAGPSVEEQYGLPLAPGPPQTGCVAALSCAACRLLSRSASLLCRQ